MGWEEKEGVLLRAAMGCSLEPLCQSSVAVILRELRRGAAALGDDCGVGFGLKQLLHHGLAAIARGPMQRGPPIAVHGIEVGLSLDEVCHHSLAIVPGGHMQRGPPIIIRGVDVCL